MWAVISHFYCLLGIRHPEELSLLRKWDRDDLKRVAKEVTKMKKKKDAGDAPPGPLSANGTLHSSSGSIDGKLSPYPSRSPLGPSPTVSLARLIKKLIFQRSVFMT